MLQRVLDIRMKRLEPDHPSVLVAMTNLAVAKVGLKKLDEAESLLTDALRMQSKRLGEGHPKTLMCMGNLAFVQEDQGKLEDAEKTYRRLIDLRRKNKLADQAVWGEMNNYAMLLQRLGRADEGRDLYLELLPPSEANLPADHYMTAIFRNNFGDCLIDLRDFEKAEEALVQSHAVIEAFFEAGTRAGDKSLGRLARLYEAWNKPEKAAEFRAKITGSEVRHRAVRWRRSSRRHRTALCPQSRRVLRNTAWTNESESPADWPAPAR